MTNPTKNDVTGDPLINKPTSDAYRSNYDRIFGKGKVVFLTKEQQAAVDDTAGIEKANNEKG